MALLLETCKEWQSDPRNAGKKVKLLKKVLIRERSNPRNAGKKAKTFIKLFKCQKSNPRNAGKKVTGVTCH